MDSPLSKKADSTSQQSKGQGHSDEALDLSDTSHVPTKPSQTTSESSIRPGQSQKLRAGASRAVPLSKSNQRGTTSPSTSQLSKSANVRSQYNKGGARSDQVNLGGAPHVTTKPSQTPNNSSTTPGQLQKLRAEVSSPVPSSKYNQRGSTSASASQLSRRAIVTSQGRDRSDQGSDLSNTSRVTAKSSQTPAAPSTRPGQPQKLRAEVSTAGPSSKDKQQGSASRTALQLSKSTMVTSQSNKSRGRSDQGLDLKNTPRVMTKPSQTPTKPSTRAGQPQNLRAEASSAGPSSKYKQRGSASAFGSQHVGHAPQESKGRPDGLAKHKKKEDSEHGASMFSHAGNVRISGNPSFSITTHLGESKELKKIYKMVALNAILNAGGRAEEVRCHPGTREALIQEIENWASDAQRGDAPRLLWLSGPAGAGKSAIVQTIAERRKDRNEPQANFFFFRTDGSRSTAGPLVPTLLYQILQLWPDIQATVEAALQKDPLLLEKPTTQDKFDLLICAPVKAIRQLLPAPHPVLLIVDGLDECDTTKSQQQIIHALGKLVAARDSPFIVLLASRKEHHIEMAIRPIDDSVRRIFLDETYFPDKDIRLFVEDEFRRIKRDHPLAGTLQPSSKDIEDIVIKSSGQFIYAAVVMRFISESDASPELSLEIVQGVVAVGDTSPFAQLDAIYTFILSRAYDWQATYELLACYFILRDGQNSPIHKSFSAFRDQSLETLVMSCVSRLSAVMHLDSDGHLLLYHKSFDDFLLDKTRSGKYWIDQDMFRLQFIERLWMTTDDSRMLDVWNCFYDLKQPTQYITNVLVNQQPSPWLRMRFDDEDISDKWTMFQDLYCDDPTTFTYIRENFQSHGID